MKTFTTTYTTLSRNTMILTILILNQKYPYIAVSNCMCFGRASATTVYTKNIQEVFCRVCIKSKNTVITFSGELRTLG